MKSYGMNCQPNKVVLKRFHGNSACIIVKLNNNDNECLSQKIIPVITRRITQLF